MWPGSRWEWIRFPAPCPRAPSPRWVSCPGEGADRLDFVPSEKLVCRFGDTVSFPETSNNQAGDQGREVTGEERTDPETSCSRGKQPGMPGKWESSVRLGSVTPSLSPLTETNQAWATGGLTFGPRCSLQGAGREGMSSGERQLCVLKQSEPGSSTRHSCQTNPEFCLSRSGCALEFRKCSLFGGSILLLLLFIQ